MISVMMKKSKKMLTVVCALMVMLMAVGCGKDKETPIPVQLSLDNTQDREDTLEDSAAADGKDSNHAEADSRDGHPSETDDAKSQQMKEKAGDNQPSDEGSPQASQTTGNEELAGDVQSVGQDSFVICKTTLGSDNIAAGPAPGYESPDDLVTVYVNPNCVYKYETVKNGGVNPEDISSREGSFADLQEGISCRMQGSWQKDFFYADSIVMTEYV